MWWLIIIGAIVIISYMFIMPILELYMWVRIDSGKRKRSKKLKIR